MQPSRKVRIGSSITHFTSILQGYFSAHLLMGAHLRPSETSDAFPIANLSRHHHTFSTSLIEVHQ